jgi:predicted short-subunit dehydrogenase-like oxidoreductase (DUF2520 family)
MADNKRIVLVGAGNVATHLGMAWQKAGYEIVQVYSRTPASALELANRLGVGYTTSLEEICADADVYVVMVKDAVLQELIPNIVKGRNNALFVHTAGSMPMNVWENHACRYGVLYPMQTFSKAREVDFTSVSFFVEATGKAELAVLKSMATSLSPKVYEANSEQRRYLHLAAVFACNFTNHMYALSASLLEKQGLPFDAMLPLIDETARKVHELPPTQAQTGPAIRCDKNVLDKHLSMLQEESVMKVLYEIISKNIQEL